MTLDEALQHPRPVVAIVRLMNGMQHPAVRFQVALIGDNRSPSGEMLRLGQTPGDELQGWFSIEDIMLIEVLGEISGKTEQGAPLVTPITAESIMSPG